MVPESIYEGMFRSGYYRNKTIAVYEYSYPSPGCMVGIFYEPYGPAVMSNKYPFYQQDMDWYTGKERYAKSYDDHKVYNTSIMIDVPKDYNIST